VARPVGWDGLTLWTSTALIARRRGVPAAQRSVVRQRGAVLPRRLVPGDYEIAITSETGKREVKRFTAAAGDADGKEIAVKLP
jgi:hypothetical protein